MRLGRIILASLTALAAYSYANASTPALQASAHDSFRLLRYVAPLLVAAAEQSSQPRIDETNPSAVLPLQALTTTPYGSSLILLASFIAVDLYRRRHQRTLLRI